MLGGSWGDARRRGAIALGTALAVGGLGIATAPAAGQDDIASVVVDGTTLELVEADGGGWTADVVLTNITKQELTLTSQPADLSDTSCRPQVPEKLPPAQRSPITVKVPAACKLTGGRFEFEIDAETPADPIAASILFKAAPRDDADSSSGSGALLAVLILLGLLALLAGLLVATRKRRRSHVTPRT